MSEDTTRADGASTALMVSRQARRTPMFDGLRGICAVALLVVHVAWTAAFTGSYTDPPKNLVAAIPINGFQIAVGVFFLLSGLFLYRPFARSIIAGTPRPELGPYFLRRVLRLIPLYYVVVAAALLLLNYDNIDSVWYVLRPFLLLQNYDAVWMAGLDITWTVPSEIQWYLALPLIAWISGKHARRGATPVARARRLMLPVPILVVVGFAWMGYIHMPSMGMFPNEFWWPIGVAANIGVGIGLGVMSALTQVSPGDTPKLFRVAAARPKLFWFAALVVFAVNCAKPFARAGYGDYDTLPAALVFYALFVLFCVLVVLPMIAPGTNSRMIGTVLENRPVVFLGRISYGIYLWHFTVMNLYLGNGSIFGTGAPKTLPELRGTIGFWELEIAVFVGSVILATLTYYLVERPVMGLGEKWIAARQRGRAPLAAVTVPGARSSAENQVTLV